MVGVFDPWWYEWTMVLSFDGGGASKNEEEGYSADSRCRDKYIGC